MSLKTYVNFNKALKGAELENKFSIEESVAIMEDFSNGEQPQRILDAISERYSEEESQKLIKVVKEASMRMVFTDGLFLNFLKSGVYDLAYPEMMDELRAIKKPKNDNVHKVFKKHLKTDRLIFATIYSIAKYVKGLDTTLGIDNSLNDLSDDELLDIVIKGMLSNDIMVKSGKAVMEGEEMDCEICKMEDCECEMEEVTEGARPKKLTGRAKKARDEKAQLMKIAKNDKELATLVATFKNRYQKKLRSLAKSNGLKVPLINFDKIRI
ncbi:hypothetical protein BPT24_128 [Tenacibaculum phage pT24]|uniref:Uncharacterized protein n=1 Tax=Tenacibaculum phage pT24 TaxID=1880590 RepID=A0A1B4XWR1_9CAUD|nr:hypothetical protein HYP10_gp128 [Tenacibaculum phage pT24]BAV39253.1 hypothetical protein BPT24_128 [Tenacibaculum phage pT24]